MKMRNRYLLCLNLCLLAALSNNAVANSASDNDSEKIENVLVIGNHTNISAANLAGSYEVIGRDQIDYLHVDDNVELFTKLPGIVISRWNQGPTNANLSIRGFGGDGPTPHATMMIDGIPSNSHAGIGEIDQIFSLNIDAIQAFKGTSDVRFGLFNIAGNYEIFTRNDVDTTDLEVTVGSFATRELQGYTGYKTGKLTHNYAFGYRESQGYRDNTDIERYALSGKWFYDLTENTRVGFISRYSSFDADSPGYLSLAQSRADPESSGDHASEDGGDKVISHYSVHLETEFDQLTLNARAYFQTLDVERWVRFSELSSLSNRLGEEEQIGFLIDTVYTINSDWRLLTGLSYQAEDILTQRFGAIGQARVRDTSNRTRHHDHTLDTTGVYASIEHQFNDSFEWNLGVRADKLDGDFVSTDEFNLQSEADIYDFGWIVQPKLNLSYQANQNIKFFFNYGESFQHPYNAPLYTDGDVNARDVSRNIGWELGGTFVLEDATIRLSTWAQDAEDEFVTIDGIARNVGETERKGWEVALTWAISDRFNFWANYSAVDTEIVKTNTTNAANKGNDLRSIPSFTSSVGLDAFLTDKLTVRTHVDSQGDYYVNEANSGGKFGGYTITSVSVNYRMDWGSLSFDANNIFDEYHEYVYDLTQNASDTIHSPGDGRSFSISTRVDF